MIACGTFEKLNTAIYKLDYLLCIEGPIEIPVEFGRAFDNLGQKDIGKHIFILMRERIYIISVLFLELLLVFNWQSSPV